MTPSNFLIRKTVEEVDLTQLYTSQVMGVVLEVGHRKPCFQHACDQLRNCQIALELSDFSENWAIPQIEVTRLPN